MMTNGCSRYADPFIAPQDRPRKQRSEGSTEGVVNRPENELHPHFVYSMSRKRNPSPFISVAVKHECPL
jgi:hypothetical protein